MSTDELISRDPLSEPADGPDAPSRATGRTPAYVALLLVAAIGGGALFVSGFMLGRLSGATPGTADSQQELFRPFWDAYNDVSNNYVGDADPHVLVQGAIKGIFEALNDPFSAYLTEEEYRSSLGGISGEFEGVGIEMTTLENEQACDTISATCRLTITRVIRGSPAITAGLQPRDVVLAVDDVETSGSSLELVVDRVRGPRGTTVVLTIDRSGEVMDISVTRDVIQREDVRSEVIAGGRVGYTKISGFSSASATDLKAQLRDLIEVQHVQALILDLRDDPGGYVDAAHKIASEYVAEGPLYWEQAATGEPEPQNPEPGGVATDVSIPLAVLVNGGTASASEIVAASLKGNDRAFLVGETTYGKGTIQEFKELPGAGGYRLSVRKWLAPDQTWIHGEGLTPDIEVAGSTDLIPTSDPVIDRAVEELLVRLNAAPPTELTPAAT